MWEEPGDPSGLNPAWPPPFPLQHFSLTSPLDRRQPFLEKSAMAATIWGWGWCHSVGLTGPCCPRPQPSPPLQPTTQPPTSTGLETLGWR